MITYIRGMLVTQFDGVVTVDVAGVGISCFSPPLSVQNGCLVLLYIEWIWSSEHGPQLYGFSSEAERSLFSLVRNCQGIGAKGALSLIITCGIQELASAIAERRVESLCKAPGVGRKRAELIVAQLYEKITDRLSEFVSENSTAHEYKMIQNALSGLGYSSIEVQRAMHVVHESPIESFEQGLKRALRSLVPGQSTS